MKFGSQSEIDPIEAILLKRPQDAFLTQRHVDQNWKDLNYNACPDLGKAVAEFESFLELLKQTVSAIYFLPPHEQTGLDSVYTRDPALITAKGAVLCNMGKPQRRGEPDVMRRYLMELGIPILGSICGKGKLEGGDVLWLDDRTMAVGLTYRSNAEGIRQLKTLTRGVVDEIIEVPMPHWNGPHDCLHLMSIISPVDYHIAVVYSRLMSVAFREYLIDRGMLLIEVPDSEFDSMGCNVLAVAPRRCIMLAGNPLTRQNLENEGIEVFEFEGEELCHKGAGGPTCLTRPLYRKKVGSAV